MQKQKKRKKNSGNFLLVLILLGGLSLLLYPTVSDYWNSFTQSRVVASYAESVSGLGDEVYSQIWQQARDFNASMKLRENLYQLTSADEEAYNSALNVGGNGVMGYIEIPTIDVYLPIYHGTSDPVLQVAIGHIEWTSLPTGGESTHCVLSGHRGLPSAKLFTNLDKLVVGDCFHLKILNEVLTYEVDRVLIVLPEDISGLQIEEGQDYCTLLTCTPYGINTHRLLVRGHRIANTEEAKVINLVDEAGQIEELLVAAFLLLPVGLLIFFLLKLEERYRRNRF